MKRTIVIIAALLMLFCLACKPMDHGGSGALKQTNEPQGQSELLSQAPKADETVNPTEKPTSEPTEAPTETPTEAPTEAPAPTPRPKAEVLFADMLPDWNVEWSDEQCIYYTGVTSAMFNEYMSECGQRGFTCLMNENDSLIDPTRKLLYSEDHFIDITDHTDNGRCNFTVIENRRTDAEGALTTAEAAALLDETPIAVFESTPDGFFESSGLQTFLCLYDRPPFKGNPLSRTACYTINAVLAGKNGAVPIKVGVSPKYSVGLDRAFHDLDGDGENDVIILDDGGTSGLFTLDFNIYGVKDGTPHYLASGTYCLPTARSFGLAERENGVFFEYLQKYRFRIAPGGCEALLLNNDGTAIELQEDTEHGIVKYGSNTYLYPIFPRTENKPDPADGVDLYAVKQGETYLFKLALRGSDNTPFALNSLMPIDAETVMASIEYYSVPADKVNIYMIELPQALETAPVPANVQQQSEIKALLGIG